jgi:N-acetylmuramoyl-L-alanine amidase
MMIPYPVLHKSPRPSLTPPRLIVVHYTMSDTAQSCLDWFRHPDSKVSAHVVIDTDGTTYRCVPDHEKAWHAGESEFWGVSDVNRFSLGLELAGHGTTPPPPAQYDAAVRVVTDWAMAYKIPLHAIVGHQHVSPGRKADPGPKFPWWTFLIDIGQAVRFQERGFDA